MAIPKPEPSFERQRKVFSKLRELQNGLNQALDLTLDCLSMGMTDDLEAAVAEGATHVRVGTAIFGPRSFLQVIGISKLRITQPYHIGIKL